MAEPNAATVEVEEDGVVTVDVTDQPDLAVPEGEEAVIEAEPKVAKPAKEKPAAKPNAADEAAAALTQAVKTADDGRKAAEATALAERRAREEAQRLAEQRGQEAAGYREQAENSQLTIINSGIETATREVESYRAESERAMEAGEFSKATAAQAKMAKAAAALDRLEDAKINFEAGAKKMPTTEGRVEAPVGPTLSAFERYVSDFTPQAQAWLRAHPECVPAGVGGDATKNAKMMAGHYDAIAKGYSLNSSEYFQTIEEHTGHRAPVSAAAAVKLAGEEPEVQPAAKPKPRMAQPSAPVSRDPPNGPNRTVRSVTLTREQQEAAKMSFPHLPPDKALAQYARNLIELEAEGKMGRLTH